MIKNRIAEIIIKQGTSVYAVAKIAGISRTALGNIIESNSIPKLDTAVKICLALGVHFFDVWIVEVETNEELLLVTSKRRAWVLKEGDAE